MTTRAVRRWLPEPTRLGWLMLFALALALGVVCALATRPASAEEPERFTPTVRGGRPAVEALVDEYFPPERAAWAMRTADCETGGTFDLYAHSAGFDRRFGVWYEHVGPWQISVPTWGEKAWELFGGGLWDPRIGAAMAAWIVDNLGPGHWPVCGRR